MKKELKDCINEAIVRVEEADRDLDIASLDTLIFEGTLLIDLCKTYKKVLKEIVEDGGDN